jgi:hypothetical protein
MMSISFADTVMGLHSQWFRNTGNGFQTSQMNTQNTAVVARCRIIHKNYQQHGKYGCKQEQILQKTQ